MPTALGILPTNQPAPVGQLQRVIGGANAAPAWPPSGTIFDNGAGQQLSLAFSSPRRCFLVVEANLLVISSAGAYNRCDASININPADLNGRAIGQRSAMSGTANGIGWMSFTMSAMFMLEANVGYVAYLLSQIQGAGVTYHQATPYLNFFGYTIGEGVY